MKTILEWFQGFPEPYRTQAIENWKKDGEYNALDEASHPEVALDHAFIWSVSTEGQVYWDKFYDTLSKDIPAYSASWQPISTAPKDGTDILLYWPSWDSRSAVTGCWDKGAWYTAGYHKDDDSPPTHWMPLPEPPSVD